MFEGCLFFNLAALWGLSTIDHLCRTSMRTAEQLHWVRILKGIRRWFRDEGACSRPPCAETERRLSGSRLAARVSDRMFRFDQTGARSERNNGFSVRSDT